MNILKSSFCQSKQRFALTVAWLCLLGLGTVPVQGAGAPAPLPQPARATIEKHIDAQVEVYGHYAAVRLPIDKGVRLWNPTAIKRGPDGLIYVANYTGEIVSLHDTDGDGLEDTVILFCDVKRDGLRYPTSLAFKGRDLYVGTTQQVRVYADTDGDGVADQSRTFFKDFPWTLHPYDWTFGLCFGPDEHLYLILSTDSHNPAPAPDPAGWRGSILRISPDGKQVERYATGVRYAPGMSFNPLGDLFFTDNRGDQNLYEELNLARQGEFYGHNPRKFSDHPSATGPLVKMSYGYAVGGLCFNPLDNDFDGTAGDAFIACWGPDGAWNEGSISRVSLWKQLDGTYRTREFPVANKLKKIIDVAFGITGDLYVAQFGREDLDHPGTHLPFTQPEGAIYRLIYAPWIKPAAVQKVSSPLVKGNAEHGKELFTARACATCHAVDGTTEMLGPNLQGIGNMLSREEILTSLREPSRNIKSGYEAEQILKKNGETVAGRLLTSNERELVLMTAGNLEVKINRNEIATQQMQTESLMPQGLLDGLTDRDVNDLLAYLGARTTVKKIGRKERLLTVLAYGTLLGAGSWFAYRIRLRRRKN